MESTKCDICNLKTSNQNTFSCDHRTCTNCYYKICHLNRDNIEPYRLHNDKEMELKCLTCLSGKLNSSKRFIHKQLLETEKKIK